MLKLKNYSLISIAVLRRILSVTLILGSQLKIDNELVTVSINEDKPLKQIIATSNNSYKVKEYCSNPACILFPNKTNYLNVDVTLAMEHS